MRCDMDGINGRCRGPVAEWRIWQDGDRDAVAVCLCVTHGKHLAGFKRVGQPASLPTKPRMTLRATKLKTVKETRHLKRPQA